MKSLLIANVCLFALAACGGQEASQPSPATPATTRAASPSEHSEHSEAAEHHHEHGNESQHEHDSTSAPTGHHHAAHGGIVKMHAENGVHLHVEIVVLPDGLVRLYPSDGESKAIAANELTGSVTCEPNDTHTKTKVDLRADAADGSAVAQCPALTAAGATVTFDVNLRGSTFARPVTVGPRGTAGKSAE